MIGFALPWILGVAVAGVLAISALHLLSVRRPPEFVLPTARFLPERDVRAVSRTRTPSDVLLLAVRIGALGAAGLAAAIPAWNSRARERVVIVVADGGIIRDTVAMRALVAGDGTASRVVFVSAGDSASAGGVDDPAALMPLAWRAASQLSQGNASIDSIDLHLLLSSAPARDAGLGGWRSAWPGRVTTHYPATDDVARRVVVVDGRPENGKTEAADDAVRAAFGWHAARISRAGAVRVDTVRLSRSDSDVGTGNSTAVRVLWPLSGTPAGWRATAETGATNVGSAMDSAVALAVGGRAMIGPFPVTSVLPEGVAADAKTDLSIAPIAWWSDGRVAATERYTTAGCDRHVAVVTDPASDILLSASANALFDRLLAPCERVAPVDASTLSVIGVKEGQLADAGTFRAAGASAARSSWIVPLLFALSLLLLVVEWRLRTRALAGAA